MMQNYRIFDENLYKNFLSELFVQIKNAEEIDLEKQINLTCITQHPITAAEIDRTFEMLDVIEFYLE